MHYGVSMGDGAVLAPDSFLMKGEEIAPQGKWGGNPAVEIFDSIDDLRDVLVVDADLRPAARVSRLPDTDRTEPRDLDRRPGRRLVRVAASTALASLIVLALSGGVAMAVGVPMPVRSAVAAPMLPAVATDGPATDAADTDDATDEAADDTPGAVDPTPTATTASSPTRSRSVAATPRRTSGAAPTSTAARKRDGATSQGTTTSRRTTSPAPTKTTSRETADDAPKTKSTTSTSTRSGN